MKFGALLFVTLFLIAACGSGSTGGDTRDASYDEGTSPKLDSQPGLDVTTPPQDATSARKEAGRGVTGDPCTSDSDCDTTLGVNGHPLCMTAWPGGGACADGCNGNRSVCPGPLFYACVTIDGAWHCVLDCYSSDDCPAGYTCVDYGCVPAN